MQVATTTPTPPITVSHAGADVATFSTQFDTRIGKQHVTHDLQLLAPVGPEHASLADAVAAAKQLSAGTQPGLAVIKTNLGFELHSAVTTQVEQLDRNYEQPGGLDAPEVTASIATSDSVSYPFFWKHGTPKFAPMFQAFVDGDVVLTPGMAAEG